MLLFSATLSESGVRHPTTAAVPLPPHLPPPLGYSSPTRYTPPPSTPLSLSLVVYTHVTSRARCASANRSLSAYNRSRVHIRFSTTRRSILSLHRPRNQGERIPAGVSTANRHRYRPEAAVQADRLPISRPLAGRRIVCHIACFGIPPGGRRRRVAVHMPTLAVGTGTHQEIGPLPLWERVRVRAV